MLKCIIVIFLFILSVTNTCYSHVSVAQTAIVYKKLVNMYQLNKKPNLYIENDNDIQAECDGTNVYITRGMLKFLKNKDELAVILGHELTHYKYQYSHVFGSWNEEYRADHGGLYLAGKLNHKYNKKRSLALFRSFMRTIGDYDSNSHPSWSKRYNKLYPKKYL